MIKEAVEYIEVAEKAKLLDQTKMLTEPVLEFIEQPLIGES